jgi:FAD/FMN-containing dehydrogenase
VIVSELKSVVGAKGWIDDPVELQPYVTDWRGRYQGQARLLVAPKSTDEVAAVVRVCANHGVAIVPQGGNTGLCGGAIPDSSGTQIIVALRRMHQIRKMSADDYSMTVDAGCTLAQLQKAAVDANRFFPLSLAAEGSCQIGGNLSTNAGGINVLRYGTARTQVLGLEVVLADGEVIDGLRSLRKDTAGYDLKQLFIGSEGTLGIITAACLRLQPAPKETNTAMVAIDSPDAAVRLLSALREALGDSLLAFELISERAMRYVLRHIPDTRSPFEKEYPWCVLLDCTTSEGAIEQALHDTLENGLILDAAVAKNSAQAQSLWHVRHSISAAQKQEGSSLKHDISVPVGSVGRFIEAAESAVLAHNPGARIVAFGHVGDGNIHFNVSQPATGSADDFLLKREAIADVVYGIVAEFDGSFSAEHGIGQARRQYLDKYRSATELKTMRAIKAALDPRGIMNPGKVL